MAGKQILVVDDVRDWREQLQSILSRDGHQISACGTLPGSPGTFRLSTTGVSYSRLDPGPNVSHRPADSKMDIAAAALPERVVLLHSSDVIWLGRTDRNGDLTAASSLTLG